MPETAELLKRPTSEFLESILGLKYEVLDDIGFVRVIDWMGNDAAIVQMARVSYGEGTTKARDDEHLIRYLMRHAHTSPFEGCEIKLHLKMPIFVARQWIRHRTASVNEYSGRYSIMKEEFFIPAQSEISVQSSDNKQGRGDSLEECMAKQSVESMTDCSEEAFALYQDLIELGVAREQARIVLPLNTYTEMYWKIDLHNLFHFLKLRCDSHAQYEIRAYADTILDIVEDWVPMATRAFYDYRMNAVTLSGPAIAMLRERLKKAEVDMPSQEESCLGKREYAEVMKSLGLPESGSWLND